MLLTGGSIQWVIQVPHVLTTTAWYERVFPLSTTGLSPTCVCMSSVLQTDWKMTVLYQLCWKSLGGKPHHTWSRRGNRRSRGLEAGGSLVAHSPAVRANRQDSSGSLSAWNSHHNVYKSPSGMLTLSEVQPFGHDSDDTSVSGLTRPCIAKRVSTRLCVFF